MIHGAEKTLQGETCCMNSWDDASRDCFRNGSNPRVQRGDGGHVSIGF